MCPFKDVHNILCKYALRLGTSMYLCANGLGGLRVFGGGGGGKRERVLCDQLDGILRKM